MTDPFKLGVDAMFLSPVGDDAAYEASGKSRRTVRVIRLFSVEQTSPLGAELRTDANLFQVRRSEIAVPAAGDRLRHRDRATGADCWFEVQGKPVLDEEAYVWTLDTAPESV